MASGSDDRLVHGLNHKALDTADDGATRSYDQGGKDGLYTQLWFACAGPLVHVPRTDDKVFYFPQGHIEQVEAYTDQEGKVEMPIYNLPSNILCRVVNVQLKAESSDEVFAQITLLPDVKGPRPEHQTSQSLPQKINASSFSKRLTASDTSTHGGFSVPKRDADACFPPLDMSREPPAQDLVAKDLHGLQWRFRHVYRGQPKRHLLTSGWSTFVNEKKLATGDACIFLRGENGELYVGVRRTKKAQTNLSASVISGQSMQHGILASAFHAISTGTMFTVYYRPWTSPADFIIPYDQYAMTAENYSLVGARFRMQFEGEECTGQKCSRFSGTVVGIDDSDHIRWPGSEWRCLKVQWDAPSETIVRPERVSPWNIEPVKVNKKCTSIHPDRKRTRSLDPSTAEFPAFIGNGLLKGSLDHAPKRHLGVLQGQEIRAIVVSELGAVRQPRLSNLVPHPNPPDWGHWKVGLQNQHHFVMHDPLYNSGAHDSVEASRSLSFPTRSVSQERKSSEEKKDKINAPLIQPIGNSKYMLFGVNICNNPLELHSQQVFSSSDLHSLSSDPLVVSQSSIPETIQVPDSSKNISGTLPDKHCKNCCSIASRSCTKVLKYETALGRSVDLARFDNYDELVCELDHMFEFKGTLIDGSSGWHVTHSDGQVDMIPTGDYPVDYPWLEFQARVRKMFICPKEGVAKFDPSSRNPKPDG